MDDISIEDTIRIMEAVANGSALTEDAEPWVVEWVQYLTERLAMYIRAMDELSERFDSIHDPIRELMRQDVERHAKVMVRSRKREARTADRWQEYRTTIYLPLREEGYSRTEARRMTNDAIKDKTGYGYSDRTLITHLKD